MSFSFFSVPLVLFSALAGEKKYKKCGIWELFFDCYCANKTNIVQSEYRCVACAVMIYSLYTFYREN